MELISKEVVRRIIDSERTREQMLEMVESAVSTDSSTEQIESSTDSSTDCISRSDMLDAIGHGTTYTSEELQKIVKQLPSVKPKERTGEWIQHEEDGSYWVECSVCHSGRAFGNKFCPDCGAKMTESEDKE